MVLNSSPRTPPPPPTPRLSAHFAWFSYCFRRLFYSNVSALRSGHHRIFHHDSSSKRMNLIQSALKCVRREFKLYIFTEVGYMMSHSAVCKDVAKRKSSARTGIENQKLYIFKIFKSLWNKYRPLNRNELSISQIQTNIKYLQALIFSQF